MTEGPRKLVVTHVISGDIWAGAEAQAFQLLEGLQANGVVTPTAVVFNPGNLMNKLLNSGIPVTCADESRLGPMGIVRSIGTHLREHQTRIVHTHGFKENVLGTLAQKFNRIPRGVRTVHGNPEIMPSWRNPKRKLTDLLDQLIGRFGQDAIIAVSSQLEAQLTRLYPGKTEKIFNFIDLPTAQSGYTESVTPKPSPVEAVTIGIVGRLVPVKRVDLFIDTIALLRHKLPIPVRGVIIGDGPLMATLKAQAHNHGLGDVLEFKGFVTDTAAELRQLDALLMTSDHEGLPMVLLEALAQKTLIIAHHVGGIPEVLDGGRAGILVENHSAGAYAEKIEWLLQNTQAAPQIVDNGFRHLSAVFSRQQNIEKYQALYAHICV